MKGFGDQCKGDRAEELMWSQELHVARVREGVFPELPLLLCMRVGFGVALLCLAAQ